MLQVLQREIDFCHTFFAFEDGGALAFFQYADEDAYQRLKSTDPDTGQHIAYGFSVDNGIINYKDS